MFKEEIYEKQLYILCIATISKKECKTNILNIEIIWDISQNYLEE